MPRRRYRSAGYGRAASAPAQDGEGKSPSDQDGLLSWTEDNGGPVSAQTPRLSGSSTTSMLPIGHSMHGKAGVAVGLLVVVLRLVAGTGESCEMMGWMAS